MTFHSEHRPLEAYVEVLADAGFLIERIRELTEPDQAHRWNQVPMFRHVRAVLLRP